jgi:excisionase family DNA binding protein
VEGSLVGDPLALTLPPEALEEIATRAAALVLERLGRNGSPWLTRAQAADYLGLPLSRLEKDRRIPCHREGRRVLYHRDELDTYVQQT